MRPRIHCMEEVPRLEAVHAFHPDRGPAGKEIRVLMRMPAHRGIIVLEVVATEMEGQAWMPIEEAQVNLGVGSRGIVNEISFWHECVREKPK